jgi:pilus assembly protein CpaF
MVEKDLLKALGPLAPLYSDPEVLEIMVDAPERVLVERSGRLEQAGVRFESPEALRAVIDAALALGDVRLAPGQTVGDVRLSGAARMLAVLPPAAPQGPCLVIRKLHPVTLTWEKVIELGAITREALDLLQGALRAHASVLIAGGMGSGKTTVANLLAEDIPPQERVLVVEEVHELQIRHPRAVFLEAAGPDKPTMTDLLSAAARMRPDWMVIGELYGPEAMRAFEIASRGHPVITTTHANSAEDALGRLEALCLMANLGLGLGEIRALVASAIQLITFQQRLPDGRRKVMQIVELRGLDNDRYVLQPLFRYDPAKDKLEPAGARPAWDVS